MAIDVFEGVDSMVFHSNSELVCLRFKTLQHLPGVSLFGDVFVGRRRQVRVEAGRQEVG